MPNQRGKLNGRAGSRRTVGIVIKCARAGVICDFAHISCHKPSAVRLLQSANPMQFHKSAFRGKTPMANANPLVLSKLRDALRALYGDQIERIVLYGSRARGDAREDSDYDVAVFLKNLENRWKEPDKIAIVATNILADTGAVIHAMPYRAGAYQERMPLMHELRREGIDL